MKMELQLRSDLKTAIKGKDEDSKDAIRIIIGEFPRLNKKVGEEITDTETILSSK